jgi:GH25 family lysozyme M1 (1,4-beta-N-acetylmuramidase)
MIYSGKLMRFGVYWNDTAPYKTMEQVKAETGCDVICNGFMYNTAAVKPVYNIKLGGAVLAEDKDCDYWGFAWDDGERPVLTNNMGTKDNFITTGVALVRDGKIVADAYYKQDILGSRGRTAIGFDRDGNLILWCSSDACEPKTMEQLRQLMYDAGCVDAINLDGGGSSECVTPAGTVTTTRTIYNFVCAWLEGEETDETEDSDETEETKEKTVGYFKGIDVSEWQGTVDWSQAENEIDFAMIRAGYGQNNIDKQFVRNISECNRLGIPCGVYWFSYASTEEMARKEAAYCLAAVRPYKVQYPIAFDFEYDSVNSAAKNGVKVDRNLATALCHAFCGAVESAGYYAVNYTNADFLSNLFDGTTTQKHDLWYAAWPASPDPDKPPRDCGIWQYASTGKVAGIGGDVDLNAAYRDYPALIEAAGLNNLKAGESGTQEQEDPYQAACEKLIAAGWGDIMLSISEKI